METQAGNINEQSHDNIKRTKSYNNNGFVDAVKKTSALY